MSAVSDLRIYLDEAGGGVFWTDNQCFNALNEAQLRVWFTVRFDEVPTNFIVSSGTDLYKFDSATLLQPRYFLLDPATPLGTGTNYLGPSPVKYFPTTMAKLEQFMRNWRVSANQFPQQPIHFAYFDAFTFRVFPSPDKQYNFQLWGIQYPPQEITTTAQDIMVGSPAVAAPDLIKRIVIKRAAERLFQYTRPDISANAKDEADVLQALWLRQWRNRQSHNFNYRLKPLVDRVMDTPAIAGFGAVKIGKQNFR